MKNHNLTKSIIMLILSAFFFIGTTYAWFAFASFSSQKVTVNTSGFDVTSKVYRGIDAEYDGIVDNYNADDTLQEELQNNYSLIGQDGKFDPLANSTNYASQTNSMLFTGGRVSYKIIVNNSSNTDVNISTYLSSFVEDVEDDGTLSNNSKAAILFRLDNIVVNNYDLSYNKLNSENLNSLSTSAYLFNIASQEFFSSSKCSAKSILEISFQVYCLYYNEFREALQSLSDNQIKTNALLNKISMDRNTYTNSFLSLIFSNISYEFSIKHFFVKVN